MLTSQGIARYGEKRVEEIWDSLGKDHLWRRILKSVVATTLTVAISLIPAAESKLGKASYLGAMATVFAHPGRRFGTMTEALVLAVAGTALGLAWSLFGIYLGSLVIHENPPAAYAIRGLFFAIAILFHGFLRSRTPRLWTFVLLQILVSTITLCGASTAVTPTSATQILYPILIGVAVLFLVNVCIFPEFNSTFLGGTTIRILNDTAGALSDAGHYFVSVDEAPETKYSASSPASGQKKDPAKPDGEKVQNVGKLSLKELTASKGKLRAKLSSCKATQRDCNFELAFSVLPPHLLKPMSDHGMEKLVANTIAVLGACESKFALLGEGSNAKHRTPSGKLNDKLASTDDSNPSAFTIDSPPEISVHRAAPLQPMTRELEDSQRDSSSDSDDIDLEMIKPKREIEFGDVKLLRYLLGRITPPYMSLHSAINRTVEVVTSCLAYAYDVPKLPSGVRAPRGIAIEEIDLHLEALQQALVNFDTDCASALERAAALQEMKDQEPDVMPREEIFLISSFLLNYRQAATHLQDMLNHSRYLVDKRHSRRDRRRLYAPRIVWKNWLNTGGDEDEALPASGRKIARQGAANVHAVNDPHMQGLHREDDPLIGTKGADLEKSAGTENRREQVPQVLSGPLSPTDKPTTKSSHTILPLSLRIRGKLADVLEWVQESEDVLYAVKLSVAVFLVTWPAFIAKWGTWYSLNRGVWAALQLVFITEVAIGSSVMTFILRGIGTTLGCLWGWAAIEARHSNRIVAAAIILIGLFPSFYVALGSKYQKAGMVCIVSMCVIALSTELQTVPGTATENFLKRWVAFMIGGGVALIIQVALLPVKARTRMVESLAASLKQIGMMEGCIASGIEEGVNMKSFAPEVFSEFERASGKAKGALGAAETFLPFCSKEPRIKGSFDSLALIYEEIVFVLHQIIDRMDNMLQLRTAYGSGPLEELNSQIYPYRRNVAASITLVLFVVHEALTTKLPLPQFLPSARLAHLRMVNRVREVVQSSAGKGEDHLEIDRLARHRAVRRKYMSFNASSAAQIEVIEYLEELIELTKLLVGANEFKSGLLTRPTYRDYVENNVQNENEDFMKVDSEASDELKEIPSAIELSKSRSGAMDRSNTTQEIPASMMRIQRRRTASIRQQNTNLSPTR